MNNREEQITILLLDNRFVDWVINPQSPYTEYWHQWENANPENAIIIEEAKNFLLGLRNAETDGTPEISELAIEQMLFNIKVAITPPYVPLKVEKQHSYRWYWVAAAVTTGILFLFGFYFFKQPAHKAAAEQRTKNMEPSPEVTRYNESGKNELVFLPDGSKVTLASGSSITYNRLFNGAKRNVSFEGKAFFDVARNPKKPFYIYTQNMIIKVLGTSFRVIADARKESVTVKTGKVSVYLKEQDLEQSAATILEPKQVCTFSSQSKLLITEASLSNDKIELELERQNQYYFEDVALEKVLDKLEKMYALPIHFDKELFKNCFITISLENESLEEKLQIITKTVGASFSISEYGINIEGKGCK